ncbi:MAG: formate dehydrogenase accessory protein FdhE [Thermodesulfovibrionales bacterium]|jgi:FdhE protein
MTMTTAHATLDKWLAGHPYLREVFRFQQAVDEALGSHEMTPLPVPQWEGFADAFGRGTSMLGNIPLDEEVCSRFGGLIFRLADRMSRADIPEEVRRECSLLHDELRRFPDAATGIMNQLLSGREAGMLSGTVRYLGWRAMERVLRPWAESLARWAAEDTLWGRPYCPLCGSLPAMAQLVRTGKGRERFLSCDCCGSRWIWQRTGCPFCGNHDQDKMEVFELEGEEHFRIDHCRECNGYIKTCIEEGDEELLLADWSSLHLDIIAGQEGFQRRAGSLFEL